MADSSTYKLRYFDIYGRGEPIRMMLHLAGKEFEDERFNVEQWKTFKKDMPLRKCPVLATDGHQIVQTTSIARYIGAKFDLLGDDLWQQTVSDMVAVSVNDCLENIRRELYVYTVFKWKEVQEGQDLEKSRTEVTAEWADIFRMVESFHAEHPNTKFINGDKITMADIFLYSAVECAEKAVPDIKTMNSWVAKFLQDFEADDKMAEYLKTRQPSSTGI